MRRFSPLLLPPCLGLRRTVGTRLETALVTHRILLSDRGLRARFTRDRSTQSCRSAGFQDRASGVKPLLAESLFSVKGMGQEGLRGG